MCARVRSSDMVNVSVRQSQYELIKRRSTDTIGDDKSERTCVEAQRAGK
jgi:hypothetical protein